MATTRHSLEIYDVNGYQGPNPLQVTGIGMVQGPENTHYYVLEPGEPIEIDGEQVTQLAVRPHYEGDAPEKVAGSICTVGIALPRAGHGFVVGERYGFSDFCFWKVGKIHPANGGE